MTEQRSFAGSSRMLKVRGMAAFAAFCFAAFMFFGASPAMCAGRAQMTTPGDRALAEKLVSGTIGAYKNYTRSVFSDAISGNFVPDKAAFVKDVEKSFNAARPLEVDFFISKVTGNADAFAVDFSWQKKAALRRGAAREQMTTGSCLFVYKRQHGSWLLSQIRGKSPF